MQALRLLGFVIVVVAIWSASFARAQNFPNKPIQVISTTAGGGADMMARLAAQGLTAALGQQAVVVNRGGSQILPAMQVAKAPPDGYTLLSLGGNLFWLYPFLEDNVPYDPARDFAPVTLTASSPNVVVVHPSLPAKTVGELIALAKAKPGALNYGAGGPGGSPHLAGELFKAMSKSNIVMVRYKGVGPAVTALLAGEVHVGFPTVSSAMSHVKTGRLRALAVTTPQRTPLAPGLQTVSASGLPGYESAAQYVVFAPAKTPADIIGQLNRTIVQFLQTAETRQKLFNAGFEVFASSPQELAMAMKTDMDRMGKIIREAGIRAE